MCSSYGNDAPKPVLSYHSCHSKEVKRVLFLETLNKSRCHHVEEESRLSSSGYCFNVLLSVLALGSSLDNGKPDKSSLFLYLLPRAKHRLG